MGLSIGSSPRIPLFSGTAAAMAAYAAPVAGDLWFTTDTKLTYVYDGAAWNLVAQNSWAVIASGTLGGAAKIDITSIPTGYKWLKLIATTADAKVGTGGGTDMILNNDTGANYRFQMTRSYNGANIAGSANAGANNLALGSVAEAVWTCNEILIHNIAATQKVITAVVGGMGATGTQCNITANWNNTADEINQITLYGDQHATNLLLAGSSYLLLGSTN